MKGCVFAPSFCHDQGAAHFAAIHKVFGASNASKLIMHLPDNAHSEAAVTISYEAQERLRDPVYGCVAHIFSLQQQVLTLQAQLASLKAQASQGYTKRCNVDPLEHEELFGLQRQGPEVPNGGGVQNDLLCETLEATGLEETKPCSGVWKI
ncbi:LOB domain-containing protein 29 [Dichanthelium oligosanthes]|uniref:LOB domain-containing protein 29 n=1 Tax=Dichanthelium oligosanthes TaxID=888268 RepID=A0A1E5VVJ7_9POAL|nr:LOB domain-containing protein 29 [Dichanthelium oligosanthes]